MRINNATPILNTTPKANTGNQVKFCANTEGISSFKKFFDLERNGTMSRKLFLLNCFIFLLGGRVLRSRDENEKRETITRDVPTIAIVALGIPFVQKALAKKMQEKSGFALTKQEEKSNGIIKKWLSKTFGFALKDKEQEIASADQIKEWYKFDEKITTGFDGFIKRLSDAGGNLKKIFSHLDEETKSKLDKFSENNEDFIKELSLSGNKDLKALTAEKFAKGSNKALEKAVFTHTIPKLLGIGVTLSLIGLMIPKLNIHITEKINKNKAMREKQAEETK